MKLIKIWHFQFGDFEIEKPETVKLSKFIQLVRAGLDLVIVAIVARTGPG